MKPAKQKTAKGKPGNEDRHSQPRRSRRAGGARKLERLCARATTVAPEQIDNVEDAKRMILTLLRVPLACEEKVCRRALRCVGTIQSATGQPVIACWKRHHDVLQPFFCKHVLPILKAAQANEELEDEF